MEQSELFGSSQATWSVTEITRLVRELIEGEMALQNVWVQGEVSNFSRPKSGHWYFTLKDAGAALPCVMWRSLAEQQTQAPRDGDALEVHGSFGVYEAGGRYQLYVDEIRPAGEGVLYQEFLRLKAELEAEGLFDPARKRPIPAWPRRIGLVTSPTGAALRDMLDTLRRRYPLVEVVLAPAAVQGPGAPAELATALERLNQFAHPDLILLTRGGGSLEDLAAFNDEGLARTISSSPVPVISGVGHETDFSIADFAADLRAPTPTAAAELATPDRIELKAALVELESGLKRGMVAALREQRWALQAARGRLERRSPEARVSGERQRVDDLARRGERALRGQARHFRTQLLCLGAKLSALSPSGVLGRGFAAVSKAGDGVVSRVEQVRAGDALEVRVSDGRFGARVADEGAEETGA